MPQPKIGMTILQGLSFLGQLGFSLAMPLILCIWGAIWLKDRFGLGNWIVIAGLILGLGGAVSSFNGFIRYVQRKAAQKNDQNPGSFNH